MENAREKRRGHRAVGTLEDDAKTDKSNYYISGASGRRAIICSECDLTSDLALGYLKLFPQDQSISMHV